MPKHYLNSLRNNNINLSHVAVNKIGRRVVVAVVHNQVLPQVIERKRLLATVQPVNMQCARHANTSAASVVFTYVATARTSVKAASRSCAALDVPATAKVLIASEF